MEPRILLETLAVAGAAEGHHPALLHPEGPARERGRALLDDDADGLLRAG